MRNCQNWQARCTLDLHGGKPSPGVCGICTQRKPITSAPITVPTVATLDCRNRGGQVGDELCKTCSGAVRVKVFACTVHGRCTIRKPAKDSATCARCKDRQEGLPAPDRIVCLNLDTELGRRRWAAQQSSVEGMKTFTGGITRQRATPPEEMIVPEWWESIVVARKVNREDPAYRRHLTYYATRQTNLEMLDAAIAADVQRLLYLEDDVTLRPGFDALYARATAELPSDWKGLWFGCGRHLREPEDVGKATILKLRGCLGTWAVLLSPAGMREIHAAVTAERKRNVDFVTADLQARGGYYCTRAHPIECSGDRENPSWGGGA